MSTKKGLWRRAAVWAAAGGLAVSAGAARADVVGDQAAAILIFPKIRVDTTSNPVTDTIIQVTNTSPFLTKARCFYVNANSHCSNAGALDVPPTCETNTDCNPGAIRGGRCIPGWDERDFQMTLTKRQPISWRASEGLTQTCPPDVDTEDCPPDRVPLSGGRVSGDGQSNEDTSIPPVQENPFVGELKCVEVDLASDAPIDRNDLKGEATIITTSSGGGVDASKYNAVGIQATGFQDGDPGSLTLGGPDAEYNACPNVAIVDHFFDNTDDGVQSHYIDGLATVNTDVVTNLVFAPCSEDFLTQNAYFGDATLQLLIYNEFEQRFSSSTRVQCYKDIQLSDIDTRVGPSDNGSSIFNASVQGTLTGQTRIRPVAGQMLANKVVVLIQEDWNATTPLGSATTARVSHSVQPNVPQDAPLPDVIQLSPVN